MVRRFPGRLFRCCRLVLQMPAAHLLAAGIAILASLTLMAGCALSGPGASEPTEGESPMIQKITADEAHEMMVSNETPVIDVRTPEEYAERHIMNARLLTLDTIDASAAAAVAPDKDSPLLVYCRSGVRSAEAAQKLEALGYREIYDFGGILDWPYATVEGADAPACGLEADQLPVGVKVVCGKTKSLPESE